MQDTEARDPTGRTRYHLQQDAPSQTLVMTTTSSSSVSLISQLLFPCSHAMWWAGIMAVRTCHARPSKARATVPVQQPASSAWQPSLQPASQPHGLSVPPARVVALIVSRISSHNSFICSLAFVSRSGNMLWQRRAVVVERFGCSTHRTTSCAARSALPSPLWHWHQKPLSQDSLLAPFLPPCRPDSQRRFKRMLVVQKMG
ncbi:hypothetical protein BKA80DRAFT_260412, partial [Phyllosticta citrichinensis]